MRIDRRRALSLLALGAGAPAVAMAAERNAGPVAFEHGVASGDPQADRVVLWTRVSPAAPGGAVAVRWEVSETADFARPAASGRFETGPARDYTVKVDAGGLQPGRAYFYRFLAGDTVSPTGRTRTLALGRADQVRLAVVSCSLYPHGYFNAYADIAAGAPVDAVVHLGDYIYEYGGEPGDYGMQQGQALGRQPQPPHEIVSLADYRTRHAQYKRDPDLQAAHAAAAWICVWDDHEVTNDGWVMGAQNHQPATEGTWDARKAAALQAYYEWMPIREPAPGRAMEVINRSFDFGDLASLIMVETRLTARSQQISYTQPGDVPMAVYEATDTADRRKVTDPAVVQRVMAAAQAGAAPEAGYVIGPDAQALQAKLEDPQRQLLGPTQEAWVAGEMKRSAVSGRPWQVLGNQVVMARVQGPNVYKAFPPEMLPAIREKLAAPGQEQARRLAELFTFGVPANLDAWDGYPAARRRLLEAMAAGGGNTLVLAGDSHAFWVNELSDDGGAARMAAEFGTTAVTSPSWGDATPDFDLGRMFADQNPEVVFCDQRAKGYVRLTLDREQALAELITCEIARRPAAATVLASFRVRPTDGPGVGPVERL